MHPRTQYLADAGGKRDPAQQPLLQDSRRADDGSAEQPAESNEKGVAAPSAPPLTSATSPAPPSATTSGYGLPSGYQTQYAGVLWQVAAKLSFVLRHMRQYAIVNPCHLCSCLLQKLRQSSSHSGRLAKPCLL